MSVLFLSFLAKQLDTDTPMNFIEYADDFLFYQVYEFWVRRGLVIMESFDERSFPNNLPDYKSGADPLLDSSGVSLDTIDE